MKLFERWNFSKLSPGPTLLLWNICHFIDSHAGIYIYIYCSFPCTRISNEYIYTRCRKWWWTQACMNMMIIKFLCYIWYDSADDVISITLSTKWKKLMHNMMNKQLAHLHIVTVESLKTNPFDHKLGWVQSPTSLFWELHVVAFCKICFQTVWSQTESSGMYFWHLLSLVRRNWRQTTR